MTPEISLPDQKQAWLKTAPEPSLAGRWPKDTVGKSATVFH
jgi:hypothetical protein